MENNNSKQSKEKGKKNPLLAQASAAAADTYTAPAPAPPRRSGRARIRQVSEISSEPKKSLTKKEKGQTGNDEEVARRLEDEEDELRLFLRARPTLTESLTSGNGVQLNVDQAVAQELQRQEGLQAGLGTKRQGDLVEDDSLSEAGETDGPEKAAQQPKRAKNAPKKRMGDRPLADGIDRTNAQKGVVDRSKLKIKFNTERDDPQHAGRVVPGQSVEYDYLETHTEPDWNNLEDIRALNIWRRQIFCRNFPPVRKPRPLWLQSEKKLLLNLMREQLERQKYLKWNRLTNSYNEQLALAGVIQKADEPFYKPIASSSAALKEDRTAPFRSTPAIMGQSSKWPEYGELIHEFRPTATEDEDEEEKQGDNEQTQEYDSGDDAEIPDPDHFPETSATRRMSGTTTSKSKTTKKAAKSITTKARKPSNAKKSAKTATSTVTKTKITIRDVAGQKHKREEEKSKAESGNDVSSISTGTSKKPKTAPAKKKRRIDGSDGEALFPNMKRN